MIIKKKEALKVLKKFGMAVGGKRERMAFLILGGKVVLSTAVPKGRGDMYCSNQFRKQLYLCEDQLRRAIRCPFRRKHFIAKIRNNKHLFPDR